MTRAGGDTAEGAVAVTIVRVHLSAIGILLEVLIRKRHFGLICDRLLGMGLV
jgi:hypothetical protein